MGRDRGPNINSTRATAHDGHAVFRSVMPYKLAIPIILDRETSDNHPYSQQNKDGETAWLEIGLRWEIDLVAKKSVSS